MQRPCCKNRGLVNIETTELAGVVVVKPKVFGDDRGFFLELLQFERYAGAFPPESCFAERPIVQLNHSFSHKGTLRGLHYQEPQSQGKLVWVVEGQILDVVVDIRKGSPTFKKSIAVELSGDNRHQVWVPPGFAHGFCVRSEQAHCFYACTDYYAPDCEHTIAWNDPELAIDWGVDDPVISDKDARANTLAEAEVLPVYTP